MFTRNLNKTEASKKNHVTNEMLARAASIYYGKLEGERLARKEAKRRKKNKDTDLIVVKPEETAAAAKPEENKISNDKHENKAKPEQAKEDTSKATAEKSKKENSAASGEEVKNENNTSEVGMEVSAHMPAEAAHSVGFDINKFVKPDNVISLPPIDQPEQQQPATEQQMVHNAPAPVIKFTPPQQQPAYNPNPLLNAATPNTNPVSNPANEIVYPAGYDSMTPSQKCDVIRSIVAASNNKIMPPYDPRQDLTTEKKIEEIKKHMQLIEGAHNGTDAIQLYGLLGLLSSPLLRTKMTEYGSVDRPNNPKLIEVPVDKYITDQDKGKFDMAFELKLKDKKKTMVVLFSSIPQYNTVTKSWNHDMSIYRT